MLRPSRPMTRPFISSFGRSTEETVISAEWSAATRWIAVPTISRAFSSTSSFALSSIRVTRFAWSASMSFSIFLRSIARASSRVIPARVVRTCFCSSSFPSSSVSLPSIRVRRWARSLS